MDIFEIELCVLIDVEILSMKNVNTTPYPQSPTFTDAMNKVEEIQERKVKNISLCYDES